MSQSPPSPNNLEQDSEPLVAKTSVPKKKSFSSQPSQVSILSSTSNKFKPLIDTDFVQEEEFIREELEVLTPLGLSFDDKKHKKHQIDEQEKKPPPPLIETTEPSQQALPPFIPIQPSLRASSPAPSISSRNTVQPLKDVNFGKLDDYLEGVTVQKGEYAYDLSYNKKITFYSPTTGPIESSSFSRLCHEDYKLPDLLKLPVFWLDIAQPTDEEMKLYSSIFNIHPLTSEDIQTDSTREKFEMYRNYYFISYCAFDQNPDSPTYLQSFNVYLLIYSDFIISFHYFPLLTVRHVIKRLEQLKTFMKMNSHWINYAILDDITDKYLPLIHSIELEVDAIDDLVLVISLKEQSDMLKRIANARKRVMTLQRLLNAKADVLRVLMKRLEGAGASPNVYQQAGNAFNSPSLTVSNDPSLLAVFKDTCLYLTDVQDHVITMVQTLQHVDTTLSRSHANYLAQINIEITKSSNEQNEGVAKLTALASILVPLNVITGLWGMNVHVPGMIGEPTESYDWFIGICIVMFFICVFGYLAVTKFGLIGARKRK